MKTLRIHYSEFSLPPTPEELLLESGWRRVVSSSRSGATPEYYTRGTIEVMPDWTESQYADFVNIWGGSSVVVEMEDADFDEYIARLDRQSSNPPPALVQGR